MHRVISTIFILALFGCASAPVEEKVDPAEARIAEGVERIAAAYEQLALIGSATKNKKHVAQDYNYDESLVPKQWLQEVTLLESYHGDLVEFLTMLSAMADMQPPRIDTKARKMPIIISVSKGRRKFISYVADAGFQAGDAAIVQPDVQLNQILVSIK